MCGFIREINSGVISIFKCVVIELICRLSEILGVLSCRFFIYL